MNTANIITEIEQIIQQELNCLLQLDKLMSLEHEAIKHSKSDELTQLLAQKNPLIIHLQELDKKRNHILICNSITPTLKAFNQLIDLEISIAQSGKKGMIILKMNSLEDRKMINKLYEASQKGVKVFLIIRGICCLIPGVKGMSENVHVCSIIDKYLEHARIFVFNNDGNPLIYSGSADWMRRNLSKRIEVIFPIYDEGIKKDILKILEIQLADNVKSRVIDWRQINEYKRDNSSTEIRSQLAMYDYFRDQNSQS